LRALPEDRRRARFFAYWTLKEAYIKARGMGLALPLHAFSFLLDVAPPIRVVLSPELNDNAAHWQFERLAPEPPHYGALAVRRGLGADLHVMTRHVVPLDDVSHRH
jgi:4'-phosphopantetheinyl transferase